MQAVRIFGAGMHCYEEQDAAIRRLEAGEQTPAAIKVKPADTRHPGAR
jgi:hypothetical protein